MGWKRERLVLPISQISPLLFCTLCQKLIYDPVQCARCQHHYCSGCLKQWKKHNVPCPHQCYDPEYTEPHMLMRYMLGQVELKCAYALYGCSEYAKQEDLSRHELECKFKPVSCGNQECRMTVPQEQLKAHREDCLGVKWECPQKCSFGTFLRSQKDSHKCAQYLEQELKEVEGRFMELQEKGARESGATFQEVMGDDLRYKGLQKYLKIKQEFKFPTLEEILGEE